MRGRKRSSTGKELRGFVVSVAFILVVVWLWQSGVIEGFLNQAFSDIVNSSQP